MDEQNAHKLLDELMSFFVGVEGTDPEDFLHPQSHPEVQCSLSKGKFMGQSREDFLIENENGEEGENADCRLSFEALFKSNGALPPDQGRSRKRQKTSAAAPAWIGKHEEAFAKLGEDIESQTWFHQFNRFVGLHVWSLNEKWNKQLNKLFSEVAVAPEASYTLYFIQI